MKLEDILQIYTPMQVAELIPGNDKLYLIVIHGHLAARELRSLQRHLREALHVNVLVINPPEDQPVHIFELDAQPTTTAVVAATERDPE